MNRTPIGQRLRFEIFKRDGFRCIYCGADANQTLLHVDHVKAVAEGGTNAPENLVTACRDCNGGKSDVPLERRRYSPSRVGEDDKEHLEQIREYLAYQREKAEARGELHAFLVEQWEQRIGPAPDDLTSRLPKMLEGFPVERLLEAFDIVGGKRSTNSIGRRDTIRYLYGVLRRWRAEGAPKPAAQPLPVADLATTPEDDRRMARARRAVSRVLERIHANPAEFPTMESQRGAIAEAFARAAWGSKWGVARAAHIANLDGGVYGVTVRGLWLEFADDNKVDIHHEEDFRPNELFEELSTAIVDTIIPSNAHLTAEEHLEGLRNLEEEVRMWIGLYWADKEWADALAYYRSREPTASILARWEVE